VLVSELGHLLPVDPHRPEDDDEEGKGCSNCPEDPELVGHAKSIALVRCGPEERVDAEDGLWQISSVRRSTQ
jgi:hypothetical protein